MSAALSIITHPISLAIIGALVGGTVMYKVAFKELSDVIKTWKRAVGKNSPGGKSITNEEYAVLGKEVYELAVSGIPILRALWHRILKLVGKG